MEQSEGTCCDVQGRCPDVHVWASITEGEGPFASGATCTVEQATRLFAQFAEHDDSVIFMPADEFPTESTVADFAVLLYLFAVTVLLTIGVARGCAHPPDHRPVCSDQFAGNRIPKCA
ncbi:MAG: hypothetical protein JXQ75_15620 [Phycisphaerae bacterium]|nr:hypothetical protein [Phycisphaerae bacterium]